MMTWLESIQTIIPTPERRSEPEIDRDLEDEFAFHLEQSARDRVAAGEQTANAVRTALQDFGDIDKFKTQCRRILLEERIMLQRVNFILMIVVLLAMVGVSVQVYTTQKHNTLALKTITGTISEMKVIDDEQIQERVLVEGAVENIGWYVIGESVGTTTLRNVLEKARVIDESANVVYIRRNRSGGGTFSYSDIMSGRVDRVLDPGNAIRVEVSNRETIDEQEKRLQHMFDPGWPESGMWREVEKNGSLIENGLAITMIGVDDVTNLAGMPYGRLQIDGEIVELNFVSRFDADVGANLNIKTETDSTNHFGRFKLDEQGGLSVYFPVGVPGGGATRYFHRAESNSSVSYGQ